MDLRLTRKIALVTGSTAGIGFAIAKALASEGAHVYVSGRTQERVDAATVAIRSHAAAARIDGIAADFSCSVGAEAVIAKLPAVDVLVNNVGIFEPRPFAEIPDADWYRLFEINVMSGSGSRDTISQRCWNGTGAASFLFRANRGFRFRRKWCTTG